MERPQLAFHPWEYIEDELNARWRTQRQFAELIDISAPALNALIKGERNITPALAVRIGIAFGTWAEYWVNLQTGYDLYLAEKTEEKRIQKVRERVMQLEPVSA